MCNGVLVDDKRLLKNFWFVNQPIKKRWSEFQGCCMYVIVRVCEQLLFFATKSGSSAKQHRLNNYDIDCVTIWDARGVMGVIGGYHASTCFAESDRISLLKGVRQPKFRNISCL